MPRSRRRSAIPAFALYGETAAVQADVLHVEPIQARSKLYRWEIDPHVHRGLHQILYVAAGPVEIALDESREACRGPVAVVIPPGVIHGFRMSRETDGFVFTFNPRFMVEGDVPATGEALRHLFATARIMRFDGAAVAARRLGALFTELAEEFASGDAGASPVPLWLGRAVIWRLARESARAAETAPGHRQRASLFTRFLVLVEAHHRDHWQVARYASELGLSPERLNRLVRAETGQTALDLIHARLAREACRRLTYIAAPISKLSFELGFNDPAYFCRFFRRHTGQSPRDFRAARQAADG